MKDTQIIMLGTGNAGVTRCYNTCFAIRTAENVLLVDAGGGNGILVQLEKAGIAIERIHDMFVTHAHTDHILGAVWVIRMVAQQMQSGKYAGVFRMYGHDKVLQVLDWICRMTLPKKIVQYLGNGIELCEVKDGETFKAGELKLQSFDIDRLKRNNMVFVPHCRMANRWFVLEMNLIMRRIVPMWKGLTGCCARLSVCIKTVIYSNLMRNTIVRHWMPGSWRKN